MHDNHMIPMWDSSRHTSLDGTIAATFRHPLVSSTSMSMPMMGKPDTILMLCLWSNLKNIVGTVVFSSAFALWGRVGAGILMLKTVLT